MIKMLQETKKGGVKMNRKHKLFIVWVSTLIFAVGISCGYAYSLNVKDLVAKHKQKKEQAWIQILDALNLTPEQKEQIQAQRDKQKEEVKYLQEKLQSNVKELRRELEKYESDAGKLEVLISGIKNVGADLMTKKIEGIVTLKKILTPAQFETLKVEVKARELAYKKIWEKYIQSKK